jgi:acetone carboxylase, gamma subunit
MVDYSTEVIADLIDGKLPWTMLKEMMSKYKDPDRFDKYVQVLQARQKWTEKILLPRGPHLFIVRKDDGSIITKSSSGFEFGDYRQNWKLRARIYVRDSNEAYREIYPKFMHADPQWMELREYYDPIDGTLLEIEAVPPGYPLIHTFQPDLEAFYRDWLKRPLP